MRTNHGGGYMRKIANKLLLLGSICIIGLNVLPTKYKEQNSPLGLLDLPPEIIQHILLYATQEEKTIDGYKKAGRTHLHFICTNKKAKNISDNNESKFKTYNEHITLLKKICLDEATKDTGKSHWYEYLTSYRAKKKTSENKKQFKLLLLLFFKKK